MTSKLPAPGRFRLLGVDYACTRLEPLADELVQLAEAGQRGYVCVANAHTSSLALLDAGFRRCQRGSLRTVPDGVPLVWCGRLLGSPAFRVYGPALMWRVLDRGRRASLRHALLGGTPAQAEALAARARRELPGVALVSVQAPPQMDAADPRWQACWEEAVRARPQLIWVGLGAPKQELLMARMAPGTPALMVGVGQAFPQLAGQLPMAPAWMQRRGLEWAFRLSQEPRRLWRRYLLYNALFLASAPLDVARQRLGRRVGRPRS